MNACDTKPPCISATQPSSPATKKMLTADEERDLIGRWRQGADQAARDRLVTSNLGLVGMIARKYLGWDKGRGLSFDDMEQMGRVGLIQACDHFDPERGRFTTCAAQYIHSWIRRGIKADSLIHVPSHLQDAHILLAKGKPVPRKQANPEFFGAVDRALRLKAGAAVDRGWGEPLGNFTDRTTLPDRTIEFEFEEIRSLVAKLPERTREIVSRYFGFDGRDPQIFRLIAKDLGLTPQWVNLVFLEVAKLRKEIEFARLPSRSLPKWPKEKPEAAPLRPKPPAALKPTDSNFAPPARTKSIYRGVCWDKKIRRWRVFVSTPKSVVNGKGSFPPAFELAAAREYDRLALSLLGDRAKLNFPEDHSQEGAA